MKNKEKKALAIIPARGGSKRIPRKNIKDFLGFPIIKYSIEAALKSNCFDEVMVSTDDQIIAEISKKYEAKVPFIRSKETANDMATTNAVLEEVIAQYQERGQMFEYICCIYPAAPFISAEKLKEGLDLLEKNNAGAVIAVVRYPHPIQRALKIENGMISMIMSENMNIRSQDLPPTYHDAGQFYWFRMQAFFDNEHRVINNTMAIELKENEVQDIDNERDWEIAEIKYSVMKRKGKT
jgi:pseudaminic acid cytidylyltransferase